MLDPVQPLEYETGLLARCKKFPCAYAVFRFHTTQSERKHKALASIRKGKHFGPCAYDCVNRFHGFNRKHRSAYLKISAPVLAIVRLASLVKTRL